MQDKEIIREFVASGTNQIPKEVVFVKQYATEYIPLMEDNVDKVQLLNKSAGLNCPCVRYRFWRKGRAWWWPSFQAKAVAFAEGSPMRITEAWVAEHTLWRQATEKEMEAIADIYETRTSRVGWDFVEGAVGRYLLNSAVITAPGTYRYDVVDSQGARMWMAQGPVVSAIGYQETADALAAILGTPVEVNKSMVEMKPGDEALVFRLTVRLNDPSLKGKINDAEWILKHSEIGILRRVS